MPRRGSGASRDLKEGHHAIKRSHSVGSFDGVPYLLSLAAARKHPVGPPAPPVAFPRLLAHRSETCGSSAESEHMCTSGNFSVCRLRTYT